MKMQHRFSVSFFAVLAMSAVSTAAWAETYTWATKDLSGGRAYWRYSAMSADGKTILLGAAYNSVFISTDSGATFTPRNPNGDGYPTNNLSGWCSAGMSSDGTKIVVCATGDYVYTSTDTGATWTQRKPAGAVVKNWNAVAMSSDGTKMSACASGDYVYTSTDSGATWTQRQPAGAVTKTWTSVVMSSDGTKIAACASGDYVYTSTDSGATWTQRQPAGAVTKSWQAVAMSSDGTRISADASGDYVYTSTDSGATWTKRQPAGVGVTKTWQAITMSSDGTKLSAAAGSDYIYTSTDSGATWTQRQPAGATALNWRNVTYSPDGSRLVTSAYGTASVGTYAYMSTDNGATWTTLYPPNIYIKIDSAGVSANGTKIIAGAEQLGDPVYTSTDSGATFVLSQPASPTVGRTWYASAVSGDGSKLATCAPSNYVYTSTDGGSTWTKCQPAGVGVTKSWDGVAMSSDASVLIVSAFGDYIYTSTDGGSTWTKRQPAGVGVTKSWNTVAISADGTKMAAGASSDYIYTSADGGATWTKQQPAGAGVAKTWDSVTMSSDGSKLAAGADNDYIYTSTDSGATWTVRQPAGAGGQFWLGIAMSSDGSHIASCAWGNYIYTSIDGGVTWTLQAISGAGVTEKYYGIAMTSDGRRIVVAGQRLYIGDKNPDPSIVTWNTPADITYGTALSATQLNATANVPGTFVYTPAAGNVLNAGAAQTLSVAFTPTDTANYLNGSATVSINVTKAPLTVTAANKTKSYGAANPTLTAGYSGFVNGDTTAVLSGAPALSTTATPSSVVGNYPISAAVGTLSAANYTFSYVAGTLSVTQATPTITWANPVDITYGAALSATQLNATASVPGTLVYTPAAGTVLNAGVAQTLSVAFTPTDGVNYTNASANVSINVTKASLTVTAANKTKSYGAANPTLTAGYSGFVNGDTAAVLSGAPALSTTATPSSVVGNYPITAAVGTLSAANYTFSYVAGTLSVTQATPTITWANPVDITYGTALNATQLNATASVPGTLIYTPASGVVLNSGAAQTLSVAFTPTDGVNYTNALANVSINVTKASLTVTADPKSKIYGAANPALTASFSGFVNGDTAAVVSGAPALSTTATSSSVVGNYPITATAGTLSAANYSFSYVAGILSVASASSVITWANPADITYGTPLSATQLNATANVPGTFAYTPASGMVLQSGAGQSLSVVFTPTDAVNFAGASANVVINVRKAVLTVTADAKSKFYGDANPALTASYSGFVNGDSAAAVSGVPSLATTAVAGSATGTYAISVSVTPLSAANYTFSAVNGTLTVDPRTDVTTPVVVIPPTVVVGGQPAFTVSGPGATNISWNFGDGQVGAGALPAHDYAAPGVYQVTVTFTDPTTGLTQSQTTTVTVQPQSFRVRSADFMLNSGNDRAAITGIVNIPDGLTMSGQTFAFTVGGSTRAFVLDAHGRAKSADGSSLSVKLKTSKGVSVQHEAGFQLNVLGSLSSAFKSKMPLDDAGYPTAITVELQFNGTFYASTQSVHFKKGPRGAAAKSKYF